MHAVRLHAHGGPEVLTYEEVPAPIPGPGQILIKVDRVAVDFADLMRRRNDPYPFPTPLPFIPGGEVAGTVAELGAGVDGPPVGTPVFAVLGHDGSSGYAELATTPAQQVVPIPAGISTEQAATLMVAGTSAMLIVKHAARLAAGESVLIPGAAGGVGSYIVQIAKVLGAGTLIGLASTPEKRERACAMGADHVLDSQAADWPATLDDAAFARFFYDPAPNQTLVAFNVGLWFALRPQVAQDALGELIGLVASGRVDVPIAAVLPLDRAADAHRMLEARSTAGKLLLRPAHATAG